MAILSDDTIGGAVEPTVETEDKREEKKLAVRARRAEEIIESVDWTIDTLREELDAPNAQRKKIINKYKRTRMDLVLEFVGSTDLMNSLPPIDHETIDMF